MYLSRSQDRFLYIDALQLQPIKLNLGFTKNADMKDVFRVLKQSSQNRTDREEEQGISAMGSEAKVNHSIVSNFPRLLAEFALNLTSDISPSPVKLNGMEISYLCKTQHQLITSLQSHYFGAILRQLYKIVGSFDFLGDPIGVLNQVCYLLE
jgi:vacuolar protein sorting-associated protein 13A/C